MNTIHVEGSYGSELPLKFYADVSLGYSGRTDRRPEDCYPGESDTIDDVRVVYLVDRVTRDGTGKIHTLIGADEYELPPEIVEDMRTHGLDEEIFDVVAKERRKAAEEAAANRRTA